MFIAESVSPWSVVAAADIEKLMPDITNRQTSKTARDFTKIFFIIHLSLK